MKLFLLALVIGATACRAAVGEAGAIATDAAEENASIAARWIEPETVPPPRVTTTELVAKGRHWRLVTSRGPVHVWIPDGFRRRRAETVVYVHGYYTNVDGAWKNHQLAHQFASSGINAVFIACEAPSGNTEAVKWTSMKALLDAVADGIEQPLPRRRIVAIGHSGAYRTVRNWLAEPLLDTVVLLDAAYGELDSYKTWVLSARKNRLINVGDGTKQATDKLHATLPSSVILDGFPSIEEEIPREAARAKILYIRSTVGHFELVTEKEALPMILRTLRAKRLLDVPLADLLDTSP